MKLLELIHSFNLHQLVSFPTHVHGHTLDLFICSQDSKLASDCIPVSVGFSDHCAVLCHIATQDPHVRPKEFPRTLRNFKRFNAAKFCHEVQSSGLLAVRDVPLDLYLNAFNSTLGKILDNHAPFKTFNCSNRQNKSFFNNELRNEKRTRSKLESKWRKNKTQVNYNIYKTQTIKYAKLLTTTKRNYFRNVIQSNISNPTRLWSTLNKVMTRKDPSIIPSTDTNAKLATKFSDFFSNKIKTISNNFPSTSNLNTPIHCDPPSPPPVLSVFHDTCDDEVQKAILASSDATCELDLMPTKILKECLPVLVKPITIIINKCFSEGKFPSIFKQALVAPLHKKHSLPKDELNSYRPISNLSFLSKVAERIILSRLQEHLRNCKSLSNFQSAYKSGFSTETALNCIQNDLLQSIDKKQVSALVLLDLLAAFDSIDHRILIDRLGSYFGIEGKVLELLVSYLKDRFQIIMIGQAKSEPVQLSTGVPQGSVLGPLLFSLYITPLSQILSLQGVKFHFYADDTQIYLSFSPSDSQPSLSRLSNVLNITKDWFCVNKLALNSSKTEFLMIGTKQQCNKLPDDSKKLIFDNQIINRSEHARNLGVVFDSDLSYKQHISNLCRCSFLNVRMVSRIRNLLDIKTAKMLVCSLVTSRLDYCNSLWFGLPDCTLHKLQLVQNSIARLVVPGTRKFDHISPILKYLHWLPIRKRIDFKIAVLTYKTITSQSPEYLYQHLNLIPDSSRRSSGKKLLSIPRIISENGRRSFAYASVSIWNSLPVALRLNPSLESFKKHLKTFLFPW
ncbi:MAG: RNA-directed DNA polymerase [Chitinophagaceae bacterium]